MAFWKLRCRSRADSGDLARGVLERKGDYWELSYRPFVWKSDRIWYQSMSSGLCPGNSSEASVKINGVVCLVEEIWGSVAFGLCHVYWLLLSSRSPVRAKEDRRVNLVGKKMSVKVQARQMQRKQLELLKEISKLMRSLVLWIRHYWWFSESKTPPSKHSLLWKWEFIWKEKT